VAELVIGKERLVIHRHTNQCQHRDAAMPTHRDTYRTPSWPRLRAYWKPVGNYLSWGVLIGFVYRKPPDPYWKPVGNPFPRTLSGTPFPGAERVARVRGSVMCAMAELLVETSSLHSPATRSLPQTQTHTLSLSLSPTHTHTHSRSLTLSVSLSHAHAPTLAGGRVVRAGGAPRCTPPRDEGRCWYTRSQHTRVFNREKRVRGREGR